MPGENCGFFGCTNNRTTDLSRRNKDPSISRISYFRIPCPSEKDSEETKLKKLTARNEWIQIVCRTRVKDSDLDRQFKNSKFYLCEIHFSPEDIEEFPTGKILRTGSVLCRNLPTKSHDGSTDKETRRLVVRCDQPVPGENSSSYSSFQKFTKAVESSNIYPWEYQLDNDHVTFTFPDENFWVPRFYAKITSEFNVTCFYFGSRVLKTSLHDIQKCVVREFLTIIRNSSICDGLTIDVSGTDIVRHTVPRRPTSNKSDLPFSASDVKRSKNCGIFVECNEGTLCSACQVVVKQQKHKSKKAEKKILPAKKKAPLSACSKEKLILTVREGRLKCNQLQNELKRLEKEICKSGCNVNDELHTDLTSIFERRAIEISPHMKLMWEEQQRLCKVTPMARRYHPQFIRFCLSLQAKSSSAYVVYYSSNHASPDRKIFFISDVPHLVKTTRNCLLSSGFNDNSERLMLNNDKYLLWSHISQAFHKDLQFGLHRLIKIGPEHINVSPFGKMSVPYGVQVLSKTMCNALLHCFPSGEADETAKLCSLVNDFFDICNVRSTSEYLRRRNQNLEPFKSVSDPRLAWLKDVFLAYFESWLQKIEEKSDVTKEEESEMFISRQTFEGYKITVSSTIEIIKFLLMKGTKYVLTERLMQDVLEEYFGYQRAHGR
eukprot:gene2273-2612_t